MADENHSHHVRRSSQKRTWVDHIFFIDSINENPLFKAIYFGSVGSSGEDRTSPSAQFDFNILLSSPEAKKIIDDQSEESASVEERKILEPYEIQIVMREIVAVNGQTNLIGVAVFNLAEVVESAHVWKRLIREEQMRKDTTGGVFNIILNWIKSCKLKSVLLRIENYVIVAYTLHTLMLTCMLVYLNSHKSMFIDANIW